MARTILNGVQSLKWRWKMVAPNKNAFFKLNCREIKSFDIHAANIDVTRRNMQFSVDAVAFPFATLVILSAQVSTFRLSASQFHRECIAVVSAPHQYSFTICDRIINERRKPMTTRSEWFLCLFLCQHFERTWILFKFDHLNKVTAAQNGHFVSIELQSNTMSCCNFLANKFGLYYVWPPSFWIIRKL